MTKPISKDDLNHINKLHRWAAQTAARGDMESSERLQRAAHTVFERAASSCRTTITTSNKELTNAYDQSRKTGRGQGRS